MLASLATLALAVSSLVHPVLARPEPFRLKPRVTGSLDSFIASESTIAYNGVLANIGASGSKVSGAGSGLVIAGPSKSNPDCELEYSS